jgi:hypothetical protein
MTSWHEPREERPPIVERDPEIPVQLEDSHPRKVDLASVDPFRERSVDRRR